MRGGHARRAPARRARWRRDPEGRRARILEAAALAFARRGFEAARVDAIARAAGVSEGTVYHQFGTKRGLLVAVGDRYGRGLARAAFGGVDANMHPRDAGVIVRNIFRYVRETEGPLAAFLLTNDPAEGGPAQDANREQMLAAVEAALRRWIDTGVVRDMDPCIAAEIQFSLVESALRECFLRHGGRNEEDYIREVTRCLTAYLGQPPA